MRRDCVMLSYDEPLANELHARLSHVFGHVHRLHGVRGMRRAYRLTAEIVDTEEFWLADGDFEIDLDFSTDDASPLASGVPMRVWRARNAVNGLEYGYGGLKLIRRDALRQMGEAVDVLAALPGKPEFVPHVAGSTRFNQSPYHTWHGAFRECAMLARGSEYRMSDTATRQRLEAWTAGGRGAFAPWAVRGARDGIAFAARARTLDDWDQINDPMWLHARFRESYGSQDTL
ncbi:hypothetical protein Ga0074812_1712 [Parafrankia irregularis]|uniref:Uncharacterized protein n=2 Tax=Frankiaceae TaxID=74712 RepID=A0A0S4R0I6_9ACTN|nr:hypothetical protein Ga0074812_1712 [Parafrankia irregularis]